MQNTSPFPRPSRSAQDALPREAAVRSRQSRSVLWLATSLLIIFTASLAYAKDYTRIVVFGDSLSDTGNDANLTNAKYGFRVPGTIANYTDGRFTDGFDTIPAAQKYFGVWVEQFAAALPSHPQVENSLDGGTNYAYGFSITGNGTSAFTFGSVNQFSVNVDNMGQQITDYLSTHPKINSSTLFVIWGGANNLLNATSLNDVVNGAIAETLNIQRLIEAGATQFLVLNLPPLGLTPRLSGSPGTSITATAEAVLFNSWLATGLSVLNDLYFFRRIAIYRVDVFSLFKQIVAAPGSFSLTDVTTPSQSYIMADPDAYLFWDDVHPTTRGHYILADAALSAISSPACVPLGTISCH